MPTLLVQKGCSISKAKVKAKLLLVMQTELTYAYPKCGHQNQSQQQARKRLISEQTKALFYIIKPTKDGCG